MILNNHEDDRGIFQELYKANGTFDVNQISTITINKNKTRGGHYHKETYEQFIILEGKTLFTLENMATNKVERFVLYPRDSIVVPPNYKHTLYAENYCKVLILCNKVFDPKNPDTYRD
jgi:dTDP-4-dehydrorhamnose 3,5-epimerase-like enzyme